ncbi:hypothetical protein HYPSUDRAFT_122231, partial [Hypholoma sublateritium FD-334 SS-4]
NINAEVLLCEACGRNFAQMNAYSNHIGSCRRQKKRMASALGSAKEKYRNKKARLETSTQTHLIESAPTLDVVNRAPEIPESLSLAERRPRRENRQRPLRYRTVQPAPPASLPPADEQVRPPNIFTSPASAVLTPARRILKSPSNVFGIFRQYFSTHFPKHDPDSNAQAADLSDVATDRSESDLGPSSLFQPYPNQNAFLLGEWYWSNGIQKTKDSFQKLVNIVSSGSFNAADVRNIVWNSIHKRLGEPADPEDMWQEEPDASWKETLIALSIPFDRNTPNPGLHLYTFPPFRHRSIVSVL